MFTTVSGIATDTFVKVDANCPITWEIEGSDVQCQLGSQFSTGMTLIFTEESLETLVTTGIEVLRTIRA